MQLPSIKCLLLLAEVYDRVVFPQTMEPADKPKTRKEPTIKAKARKKSDSAARKMKS
jgi:hypothetical protein